jgi:hypothetical protein
MNPKRLRTVFWCILLIWLIAGCSSPKKEGEECDRNGQCEGLLVCHKDSPDKKGKCMRSAEAKRLHEKKKGSR